MNQYQRFIILFCLGLALLILYLKGTIGQKTILCLSLAFLLVDLSGANQPFIQIHNRGYEALKTTKNNLTRAFEHDSETFRVGARGHRFGPNAEMFYGLQSATGAGPVILYRYYLYCDRFARKFAPPGWQVLRYGAPGSDKFMDLLNVKYEINHDKSTISLRKNYLPRALLVPSFRVMKGSQILTEFEGDGFDPRETILLEEDPLIYFPHLSFRDVPSGNAGTCKILFYGPDEIQLRVNAGENAFLLVNDVFYPGWKCYVDGVQSNIQRGNFLFRAVGIPRGNYEVSFIFDPPRVKIGIAITLGTLFLFLLVGLREILRLRRR